ncbi:hypothetical protein BH11BAC3_BH11BAC3_30100 [soil metagenome]
MNKLINPICLAIAFLCSTKAVAQVHIVATKKQVIKDTDTTAIVLQKLAPDFTLKNPEGNTIQLSSFNGKIVLVDFWASWCMPCRAMIPHLKALYEKYHALGFEILSVSADANPVAWKKALAKEQMPWNQVIDHYTEDNNYGDLWIQYKIEAVPYAILLDKDGKVIAIDPTQDQIESFLLKNTTSLNQP